MDGLTLLSNLKEMKIMTPVIVLTNLSQESDVERTKKFGVKEFFIKSNTPIAVIAERVIQMMK